jgi:hypothetical protein
MHRKPERLKLQESHLEGLRSGCGIYGLQNESRRACPELVERGRLNLAQDAVLGGDARDEKSRRDDWKLPGGNRAHSHLAPRIQDHVSVIFQSSLRDWVVLSNPTQD